MNKLIYNIRITQANIGKELELETTLKNVNMKDFYLHRKVYKSFYSWSKKKSKGSYIELMVFESEEQLTKYENSKRKSDLENKIIELGVIKVSSNQRASKGWNNDLLNHIESAGAIEFGLRELKKDKRDLFLKRRAKFMSFVKKSEGIVFDYEMESIDDKVIAIVFGWKTKNHFDKGSKTALKSFGAIKAFLAYFPMMNQVGFQVGTPIL